MPKPRVVVVMGVAGSGKSTVGALLAVKKHGQFFDADEFHSAANIEKMANGIPLNDEDRWPWLDQLRREVIDATPADQFTVLACSALKKVYRERLGIGTAGINLVYLKGPAKLLAERLEHRTGHYMNPEMLESQLATLEEPAPGEGQTFDINTPVTAIVADIERTLWLSD